jgi:hypothetical protein
MKISRREAIGAVTAGVTAPALVAVQYQAPAQAGTQMLLEFANSLDRRPIP